DRPRGLVLITGPTGSGKSTTLAALLDKINSERHGHILTIEDPIEFIHPHKSCLVNQREVHSDTGSFSNALRAALREDPDIVLIGEMRDLETVEAALKIAETGHLTFGTLHTNSAAQTINRIIDIFPAGQQAQIRTQLSLVLEGIVCQALLPRADGKGRVASLEILVPTAAIRNLIRDDKVHQIYGSMQTGQEKLGMQTANQSLASLYLKRLITLEVAMNASSQKDELQDQIMVTRITPAAAKADTVVKKAGKLGKKVKAKNLAVFTRQFSVMIDAGLPLVQCLEILGTQEEDKNFAAVILQTRADVEAGASLADAMRRHPKTFDPLFTNMIAAGEAGGILDTILKRLATYIEKAVKLAGQVKSAMVYPIAVICIAGIVVGVILWKVIPTFAALFSGLGASLPLPTRVVIALSDNLVKYFPFLFII